MFIYVLIISYIMWLRNFRIVKTAKIYVMKCTTKCIVPTE